MFSRHELFIYIDMLIQQWVKRKPEWEDEDVFFPQQKSQGHFLLKEILQTSRQYEADVLHLYHAIKSQQLDYLANETTSLPSEGKHTRSWFTVDYKVGTRFHSQCNKPEASTCLEILQGPGNKLIIWPRVISGLELDSPGLGHTQDGTTWNCTEIFCILQLIANSCDCFRLQGLCTGYLMGGRKIEFLNADRLSACGTQYEWVYANEHNSSATWLDSTGCQMFVCWLCSYKSKVAEDTQCLINFKHWEFVFLNILICNFVFNRSLGKYLLL